MFAFGSPLCWGGPELPGENSPELSPAPSPGETEGAACGESPVGNFTAFIFKIQTNSKPSLQVGVSLDLFQGCSRRHDSRVACQGTKTE